MSEAVVDASAILALLLGEPGADAVAVAIGDAAPEVAAAFAGLRRLADMVLVEGVGGFCVPLDDATDTADLAALLDLPPILVVGMRLGCINHALLTAQAIAARGLPLAGWVANRIDPAMSRFAENLSALQARLPAPLLGASRPEHLDDTIAAATGKRRQT